MEADAQMTGSTLDVAVATMPVKTSAKTLLVMTEEQKQTLVGRVERYYNGPDSERKLAEVSVFTDSGGLPEGWVYVIFTFRDGGTLHGGISPDGDMHT